MAEFVDGHLPVPALPPFRWSNEPSGPRVDLCPVISVQRGFHTCEKSPLNGGYDQHRDDPLPEQTSAEPSLSGDAQTSDPSASPSPSAPYANLLLLSLADRILQTGPLRFRISYSL